VTITLTRYIKGKAISGLLTGGTIVSTEEALADMFTRLHAGADLHTSGFSYGLTIYTGPEFRPTGYDRAIYANAGTTLDQFLIDATSWWRGNKESTAGSPEQDQFIRLALLRLTGHVQLPAAERQFALDLSQDEFIAAMAMSLEANEGVAELFRPTVSAS
jgi:hypothetical protein